jgi:hypothetical protein
MLTLAEDKSRPMLTGCPAGIFHRQIDSIPRLRLGSRPHGRYLRFSGPIGVC